MTRSLIAACVLCSLLTAPALADVPTTKPANAPTTQPQSVEKISIEKFEELRTQPGQTVLDVRTPAEFADGHVPGAIHVPIASGFDEAIAKLDKSKPYLVYCHSGKRSFLASQRMTKAGFTDVKNFAGGIVAWENAKKPMETGNPAPAK